MNDNNMPTNVQLDTNANGSVSFAADVVATIAGLAATEIDGVASMTGANTGGLADILSRRMASGTKNLTKGVKVEVQDGKVTVDVSFVVEYGSPVPEVAKNIQENVKKAIETMSGLTVEAVDVHVQGVSFERENKAVAEIEQQQRLLLQKQGGEQRAKSEEPAPVKPEEPSTSEQPVQEEEQAEEPAVPQETPEEAEEETEEADVASEAEEDGEDSQE